MKFLFFSLYVASLFADDFLDLEADPCPFVIEVRKIEIPGFPIAFNPSIVRYQDKYLMSFRNIPDRKNPYTTHIGLIWLDQNFDPIGEPQILITRSSQSTVPPRGEDGRLIWVKDHLYMIYDDNEDPIIGKSGYRLFIGEIHHDGKNFFLHDSEKITQYEGADPGIREKAWTPFIYENQLLLSYSFTPHRIVSPLRGKQYCKTVAETSSNIQWPFGILRGGTPALKGIADKDEYFGFFHSCIRMGSKQSEGRQMLHYFIGAFTFSPHPPFEIRRVSKAPIIAKQFYSGEVYKPYWHPLRVVFPVGYVFDEKYIYMVYGRQDHEIWLAKLDREGLMNSLEPVTTSIE